MNYVTCANVRNISLCLPVYRHRREWVPQANTPEPVATPSSPSCCDCSSYTASFLHRCHPCSHLSWAHVAPYMASSLWPLTEWLSLSLQTPLLRKIFQCNSFPADSLHPAARRIAFHFSTEPYNWLFHRALCKHHAKAILQSLKFLKYIYLWSSISTDTVSRKTFQIQGRKTLMREFWRFLLEHAHQSHCLAKHTSTSFSK